jgi:hypothetical protein
MLRMSASQASTLRSCKMKYKFQYIDKLTPIKTKSSLTLGKIIHDCFEKYYNGMDNKDILAYINLSFAKEIANVGPEDVEDLTLAKYTALGMWLYYPHDKHFEDMQPEVDFNVSMGWGVRLVGRVDGLIKKNNKYWIREAKTTGLSIRQFEGRMQTSYQATGYMWAVQKALGKPIQGLMYDCLKKPLLRKRSTETAEDFGKRIMDDYGDPIKQKHYFTRHYTYRTPDDLRRYEEDMKKLIKDLRRSRNQELWYRNPDACFMYNSECPYRKICFMDTPDPLTLELYFKKDAEWN